MNVPGNKPPTLRSVHSKSPDGSTAAADAAAKFPDARAQRRATLNLLEDAIEAREALEKLNVELRRLAGIVETSDDAIISRTLDGIIMTWNRSAERMYGYTAAEAVGQHIDLIIPEERRAEDKDVIMRLCRSEKVEHFETIRRSKDGRTIDISLAVSPIRDTDGRIIGASKVARDVTERNRAAQEARRRASQLAVLMETAAIGLHRVGPDGTILWANATEMQMLGYAPDDYVGRHISEFHADQDVIAEILDRQLRGENLQDFEARLKCKDGAIKTVRIDSSALFEDGHFVYTQCFTTDVTDRTQAEQALRDSEAKYRTIFEGAAVSLWEEDFSGVKAIIEDLRMEGVHDFRRYFEEHPEVVQQAMGLIRVLDANDATVKMFRARDKAELLGALPKIFVRESVFIEELVTVAEKRTFLQAEALLNTVTGAPISVLFTMTLPSDKEKLDRVLFSLLDITERVRLEKQMQEHTETLADLHRRKDEFLAMLSHELRNPLAPIANAVQLLRLQRGSETQIQQQARTIIERQVGQLRRLIDDLLEVSRVTTGKFQVRLERIAMGGIVEGAVETVRPLIEARRHQLSVSVPTEPVWLHADAARLEQVVVNLLTNAAKYTEEGGQIDLSVEREGDMAALRVRDTGVGISREFLPHIFDLFAQAERAPDRSQGGLGIGLSLAKRLVEVHGGTLEAFSTVGQGSEFVVRLPAASMPSTLAAPAEGDHSTAHRCRVLVVEDNVDSAESLAMLLRAERHDVRTTHDSRTALQAALDYEPDVVLLDIGLPGLSGYEVARRMREQPTLQDVVLVALTGYGQETDRLLSRQAGFDHHLVKPADFGRVQDILATVLERAP
jgi:PAS domain S-box-containing protein